MQDSENDSFGFVDGRGHQHILNFSWDDAKAVRNVMEYVMLCFDAGWLSMCQCGEMLTEFQKRLPNDDAMTRVIDVPIADLVPWHEHMEVDV